MPEIRDFPKVSAVEVKKHLGRYQDEAQRVPVGITKHGRVNTYLVSSFFLERVWKLVEQERKAELVSEFPDDVKEEIAALARGETPQEEI